jgi:hypothetical protein
MRAIATAIILIIAFTACENQVQSNQPDEEAGPSNLSAYLSEEVSDPVMDLGTAIAMHLAQDPVWESNLPSDLDGSFVYLFEMTFDERPEAQILSDYFHKKYYDFVIESDFTFTWDRRYYAWTVERYGANAPTDTSLPETEVVSPSVMVDPDLYNDEGDGVLYYNTSDGVKGTHIVLRGVRTKGNIYFLSKRHVHEEDITLP